MAAPQSKVQQHIKDAIRAVQAKKAIQAVQAREATKSRIADIWYHKLEADGVSDDQFQRDVQLLHDAMQTGEQSRIETALGVIHPSVRDIVETHVLALRRCSFGQAKAKEGKKLLQSLDYA